MKLPSEFWARTRVSRIPALDTLRNTIIQSRPPRLREEGKKFRWPSMPKWHFRLPSGVIVHLQPKINPFNGFEGTAEILIDEVGIFYLTFRIIINNEGEWFFKPWAHRSPYENCFWMEPKDYAAQATAIRERVMAEIGNGFAKLNVGMMLSPACLLCGRALTDPVSQARWVGPECWGSASAIMPFIVSLTGGTPDLYWE
jgi:hypothetical protein